VIDERTGTSLLFARFEAAGLSLESAYQMTLAGRTVRLDGFDPHKRVGFEYITTAAGDREEMTAEVVGELEAKMRRGDLYVLLVDEREVASEEALTRAADHFLRVVSVRLGWPAKEPAGQ
jgi:hypothetical protein